MGLPTGLLIRGVVDRRTRLLKMAELKANRHASTSARPQEWVRTKVVRLSGGIL